MQFNTLYLWSVTATSGGSSAQNVQSFVQSPEWWNCGVILLVHCSTWSQVVRQHQTVDEPLAHICIWWCSPRRLLCRVTLFIVYNNSSMNSAAQLELQSRREKKEYLLVQQGQACSIHQWTVSKGNESVWGTSNIPQNRQSKGLEGLETP